MNLTKIIRNQVIPNSKLALASLASLVCLIALLLAIPENKLVYSELWVTANPTINSPKGTTEDTKHGKGPELLEKLQMLKKQPPYIRNWQADRRYKSSFVYLESLDKTSMDSIHKRIKSSFTDPIFRILPQRKINTPQQLLNKALAIGSVWLLLMCIILTKTKTTYITVLILILIVVGNFYIKENKKWVNQVEFDIKSPYKKSQLSYGHLQALTSLKTQIGEITVRILEGENKRASFKIKSAHRIYNQKGKKTEVERLWVRSDASPPEIDKAIVKAQNIVTHITSLTPATPVAIETPSKHGTQN